ncbi:MAG: stage V sporulation protein SpoVM [Ruminiclostridium sp.]|nr:stage V sporulation protein SpoVM [Ruminiclostridium sp.]MBQ2798719.1 stage V sporulation protein SpoVM [Ruminiclostridium sp.]MBQ8930828.1 stage V sporulation protein SpoVM [Ruminiclostridium sp.]MBQ8931950.1 stage V sporulation protein SpoVM [Ruminiclostridium sp.]
MRLHSMKVVVYKTPKLLAGFLRLFFGIRKTQS